jgi:uncharacterized protein YbjT (DUF2867 family)
MDGVQDAYYLVHSMGGAGEFADLDRRAATNFAAAATRAGLERIVYLGGLGNGGDLSPHLASRQEVGAILRTSGVPTIELRASIVIGSGSASFEAVRALLDALPVIPAPRSVETGAQPIAKRLRAERPQREDVERGCRRSRSRCADQIRRRAGGKRVIFLAGDDIDAKAEVISLFKDAGFFTIDLGSLIMGGAMQQLGAPLAGMHLIRLSGAD